jgi:glutamine cyclotransferase
VAVRGVLGWPRTQVPLTTITHADVEDVHPMAYGGWGWRMRTDRTAIVTSSGPGLVVHRSDGASLVVTVDGADEAAGVVNRLVDRREAARAADPA